MRASDPTGLHRVLDRPAVLPQAADRLDTRRELWPDEVRVRVERLNLDAASFRQLERTHAEERGVRSAPRCSTSWRPAARCRTPRPGPAACSSAPSRRSARSRRWVWRWGTGSPRWSRLTLTPLVIEDGLARWDGRSEQVPCDGYAVLFGRSIAARIPDDLARRAQPRRDGRLRRSRAHGPCRGAVRAAGGRGHRRRRQVRLAEPGGRPARRRPAHRGRRAPRGRGRAAARLGPRRRRRGRGRPRPDRHSGLRWCRPSGGRPTSPWCASTCRAARAARSWPPPPAGPSSSSRWRPRSPPRRWVPRAWPPTSRCWSATATCPGHADYAMTLLRENDAVRRLFEGRLVHA